MILLTVGTTTFPFCRLIRGVDEVLCSLRANEELIAQIGNNNYKFNYPKTKIFKEIPFNDFVRLIAGSRLVISHGGLATSVLCLNYAKNKPIIVPRLKLFKEHVDNHQIYFLNYLVKNKRVFGIFPKDNMEKELKYHLTHTTGNTINTKNNTQMLVGKLSDYLNKIEFG